MPELLARSDHDFVLTQSRPGRRAAAKAREPGFAGRMLRAALRNPGQFLVGIGAIGFAVAIGVNALSLQQGRHPAPFFAPATPAPAITAAVPTVLPPPRPATLTTSAVPGPAPTPAPAPAPAIAAQPATDTPVPPRPVRPQPAQSVASAPATPVPARDPIADLLRTTEPSKSILAAQKGLNRLGYGPVKPDGVMGAGTRQAIERFEKDRRIPVTGDVSPRLLREIAAAGGQE